MAFPILREPFNALSHMAGAIASIAGLTLLVVFAAIKADVWHVVSFSIFGATLVLMYTSSTLYHGLRLSQKGIAIMRKIDHITIFMLIAGTYTPFCLVPLRGPWGWSLLITAWTIALAGIFLKLFCFNVPRWISTAIYLIMGWIFVVAVYPLVMALNLSSLIWLGLGGLFYSGGALIYGLKRPNPRPDTFGFHGIWHLFVLSGSFCHFWAVFCFFK
ncbi:hemolysin III [Desulfocicer vacuolatum DSM 3385]|uniref:Hemolysin III n=1 Tax=Desulfocicer vacuolatum DSM 3385 TaxID=1121400 RepID=A0A1W2ELF3_9BACT|nr:hemolysin III family protein [Desulfocicer vacuolatum]SMD10342.1 hemolysin III [Desulfocicer vacuolatum DSM 3385]